MVYGQKVPLSGFDLGSVQVRLFAKKAVFIGKSRFLLKLAFGASLFPRPSNRSTDALRIQEPQALEVLSFYSVVK